MSHQQHERLIREAIAASTAARAARWRALVIACQIEKLIGPHKEEQKTVMPKPSA
jgi:hypothetical protein